MENERQIDLINKLNGVSNVTNTLNGVFVTVKPKEGQVTSSVYTDSGLDELLLLNEVLQAVSDRANLYPFLDKFQEQLDFANKVLVREITNNIIPLSSKPVISPTIYQPSNESNEGN